jgi:hypothetical protein
MKYLPYSSTIIAKIEVERRRECSSTYTEPLPKDSPLAQSFLKNFYSDEIFDRIHEFKADLIKYNETVGEHYKYLVPEQVSFDEFFSRYLYRCNVAFTLHDWAANDNDLEKGMIRAGNPLWTRISFTKMSRSTTNQSNKQTNSTDVTMINKVPSLNQLKTRGRRENAGIAHPWGIEALHLTTTGSTNKSQFSRNAIVKQLLEEARDGSVFSA